MKILQRLKDGANRATEKAQGAVEISKLNNQIADVQKEMEFHFIEMGRVFYEGYSQEDMTLAEKEMLKHCKTCDGLQEEIEQLRRRIAELKNEKLCKCGRTVELDANFCPSCGRSLKGEAPASAGDEGRKSPAAAKFEDEDFGETKIYREPIVQDDDDFEFELAFDKEETGAAAESLYDFPGGNDWKEPQEEEFADERERRQAEERERERQLELDERIRFWKENNDGKTEAAGASQRDSVKCQICRADLPKGSKWCPRCGAEQI